MTTREAQTTEDTCTRCGDTGWVLCLHPTTEIDSDGDRVCLACDEIIDGREQPQLTLCPDCQ